MVRPDASPVVAMKVLMKIDEVAPVCIVLKFIEPAINLAHCGSIVVSAPRPRIAEPNGRKNRKVCSGWTSLGCDDPDQDVFGTALCILCEITVLVKSASVEQLILEIRSVPAAVFFHQPAVRKLSLWILVQSLHVGVRGSRIQIEVIFLDVLAVISLEGSRRGHQTYYRANRKNPIFGELKSILTKTSGIRDILHEVLVPLADRIKLAFVYGSIARGAETASSDVDLTVVGKVSFADVVSALSQSEAKLGREVNPTVYSPSEFREKLAAKNHFLSAIAQNKKLFVTGDESEFRRLGQERLARRA